MVDLSRGSGPWIISHQDLQGNYGIYRDKGCGYTSYHIKIYRGIMADERILYKRVRSYHIKIYRGIMARICRNYKRRKSYHIKIYRGIMAARSHA